GSFLYSVNGGWNMVSLPLDVEDAQKTSVFPTASTNAFKYDGAYVIADVLEVGAGYWLKFSSVQDVQITGATIKDNTVDLVAGWNMIGGISDAIATTAILQTPPGIVESPYFGYNAGYVPADSLIPSRAYWVKAGTGGGQITLSSEVLHKSGISELERLQGFNTITLCDKNGASQTLYVGKAPEDGLDLQRYELPPSPPTGLFDARFTSGRFVEVYPQQPAETKNIPITVSSAAYPITVSWEIADEEKAFAVSCITEKSMIKQPMKGAGNIVIQQPASRIAITVSDGSSAPKQFALGECYPNPFNPTTLIRYSLPVKSIVTLNVFNLLGQEITTLLDGQEVDKGEYEISFNAASLPSGVYIYRINAVGQDGILSYTDTKRMVLMK
ncbi:MAG: T9SS type A sorting domain-containing protein, partial [Bacteroidetes bacterium]